MKIRHHAESHIVELDDGSTWRTFNYAPDIAAMACIEDLCLPSHPIR
jgi:hypothetical protein